MKLSIATWNVNSIRARINNVTAFLKKSKVDVLCMQETKVENKLFPLEEFEQLGYNTAIFGQKRFNGVATVSKFPFDDVQNNVVGNERGQKRTILTVVKGITIINSYFPNGQTPESENFAYKLEFIKGFRDYMDKNFDTNKDNVVIVGDFNVAKENRDVYDIEAMEGKIGFHPKEREALEYLYDWGFIDAFRMFKQDKAYSWWDYRALSFRRNLGLRIDYIWISKALKDKCLKCYIDKDERKKEKPSDHAPVVATFEI
jgi:exodeoxyribonuclease-3